MKFINSPKKRLSATVYYLLAGLALGWPGLLATGDLLPAWQQGAISLALSLATVHLLVLGSMWTIAFGVLYQIVPIAFQAQPIPRHVLYWHLPIHILSIILMVIGFLRLQFFVVGSGGILLFCNTVAYFLLLGRSYFYARNKTAVHKSLSIPLSAMGLVILVGLFQAFFPSQISLPLLLTHVLLGGFAFWGGLVLVFSYKLVPMFIISHGYKTSLIRSGSLYFVAVALWIVSNWLPDELLSRVVQGVSCVLLLTSLVLYVRDMIAIGRAHKKRTIVLPMWDASLAMVFLVLGQAGIVIATAFHTTFWVYPSAYLFAFGGLIALMYSYMQKMVPFLWFEYRFSKRPERKTAPLIDDMVPKRIAQWGMVLYFMGVIAGVVGLLDLRIHPLLLWLSWVSAVCMTLGSMLLFVALRFVLTIGGTRPVDCNTNYS
ncbi:hypothetical protein D2Q93_10580 [Alicyclobacillaceae bacterium I2511]|nr:hypothetical protein D2Q93_10580 [Alicyclobacillaceae bacterium I2511]